MGSKMESKRIAEDAGVACVPVYYGNDQTPDTLFAEAVRIGFPVLTKASAGGGGRGMRRVDLADDFHTQLELAKEESRRAFGDDRVLIEKLITNPRHLEVQLLGDRHGNLVHLYERECSIQRNYQKLVEEAPAAWLTTETRDALLDSALKLGNAIQYDSAGTVEFVLDEDTGIPYFMEMNTRLQVEHTVTELVTGLDLVELQLLSASGAALPLSQPDVRLNGWAIEARINCEDPAQGYQPQIGTLEACHEPSGPGLRIDSGVTAGSVVSPYYDSMIAKLMGHGRTRALAAQRLRTGLEQFHIAGVGTNVALLHDILSLPGFLDRPLTTHFMVEHYPEGWQIPEEMGKLARAAAAWMTIFPDASAPGPDVLPWLAADGFRTSQRTDKPGEAIVHVEDSRDTTGTIRISRRGQTAHVSFEDGTSWTLDITAINEHLVSVEGHGGEPAILAISGNGPARLVSWRGITWNVTVIPALEAMAGTATAGSDARGPMTSPMPGDDTEINVEVGQTVSAREVLLTMEAMKLIHPLESEVDGVVKPIHCAAGETVGMGVPWVEIDTE